MWNSFRTDASDGLTAEVITYPGGHGDEIHAYVVRPSGDEPVPGIVAVHHLPGWDEFYQEFSDRVRRPVRSRRSTTPPTCPRRCSGCSATTTGIPRPRRWTSTRRS